MDTATILSHVDHTLLKPEATWEQIKTLCDEAMEFGCATVCIPPSFVKQAAAYVQGNLKICTVIGFPNGYNTTAAKIFETKDAVENGASEIDMVINNGMVKDRQWDDIAHEIAGIKAACLGRPLKVIQGRGGLRQDLHRILHRRRHPRGRGPAAGEPARLREGQSLRRHPHPGGRPGLFRPGCRQPGRQRPGGRSPEAEVRLNHSKQASEGKDEQNQWCLT